jgi:glycosyltransferase involved in cell wall biosynthesis
MQPQTSPVGTAPTVSLIMTVYNRDRYLEYAIASILVQTEPDFELLIWDDGSTDGSLEIARYYAKKDQRIRLFTSSHQGRSSALQAAHAEVRGTCVGWVDSDDVLSPIALEKTLLILKQHPEVGMVYTDFRILDENNMVHELGRTCTIPYSKEQLLLDFITFHFRLLRHSVYEQSGGVDCSFSCAMDYDLCLKLSEITEVYHLQEPLYFYRIHSQRVSAQRRLEQIECSLRAVTQAIERRGLSEQFELEVEITSEVRLKPKPTTLPFRDAPLPSLSVL